MVVYTFLCRIRWRQVVSLSRSDESIGWKEIGDTWLDEVSFGGCRGLLSVVWLSNQVGVRCHGQLVDRLGPGRSPVVLLEKSHVTARGVDATLVIWGMCVELLVIR